jgi:hypothetical protein
MSTGRKITFKNLQEDYKYFRNNYPEFNLEHYFKDLFSYFKRHGHHLDLGTEMKFRVWAINEEKDK